MDINDYQVSRGQLHFWHQARLGLLAWLIKQIPGNNLNIASIGSGTGEELNLLKKRGSVVGWDINKDALTLARQLGFVVKNFDISQNTPEDKYDLVCAFDVLEHLKNDLKALNNINACLKTNGYLLLTVPAHPWLFSAHDLALNHQRRYSRKELAKKLQTANFKIKTIGYWNAWFFPLITIIRLIKKFFPRTINKSEAKRLPKAINHLGFLVLKAENYLLTKNFKLPVGLSLYVVAKKYEPGNFNPCL